MSVTWYNSTYSKTLTAENGGQPRRGLAGQAAGRPSAKHRVHLDGREAPWAASEGVRVLPERAQRRSGAEPARTCRRRAAHRGGPLPPLCRCHTSTGRPSGQPCVHWLGHGLKGAHYNRIEDRDPLPCSSLKAGAAGADGAGAALGFEAGGALADGAGGREPHRGMCFGEDCRCVCVRDVIVIAARSWGHASTRAASRRAASGGACARRSQAAAVRR